MSGIIQLPIRQTQEVDEIFKEADFFSALHDFETRLGGVRLADLEAGNEDAAKIADKSLRKIMFKMLTNEANQP